VPEVHIGERPKGLVIWTQQGLSKRRQTKAPQWKGGQAEKYGGGGSLYLWRVVVSMTGTGVFGENQPVLEKEEKSEPLHPGGIHNPPSRRHTCLIKDRPKQKRNRLLKGWPLLPPAHHCKIE